eukprot:CAMPEP_0118865658 /NCGR_PEP_ID=MMETSP1163-20130328/9846_1 /TAXON_ID=124430 /ORGANISM="Phaeomonas parva, Strain CCMP2877" /LENGTH=210 /DNA_ID=CAMNT_0006799903 /DNA_START=42 /DNA_END=674 /DNA_ORIENTATION=+
MVPETAAGEHFVPGMAPPPATAGRAVPTLAEDLDLPVTDPDFLLAYLRAATIASPDAAKLLKDAVAGSNGFGGTGFGGDAAAEGATARAAWKRLWDDAITLSVERRGGADAIDRIVDVCSTAVRRRLEEIVLGTAAAAAFLEARKDADALGNGVEILNAIADLCEDESEQLAHVLDWLRVATVRGFRLEDLGDGDGDGDEDEWEDIDILE